MGGYAWQAVLAHLGDPLEPAQPAPVGGHLLEAPPPELAVETLERELGERGPDRGLEVLPEVALSRRRLRPSDRRPLPLDLGAAGKPAEALAVDGEGNDRVLGPKAGALIDTPLLEVDQSR